MLLEGFEIVNGRHQRHVCSHDDNMLGGSVRTVKKNRSFSSY